MALGNPVSRGVNENANTGQTSLVVTIGATGVAQNSLIVVAVGFGNVTSPTLTLVDSKSNTYQLDILAHNGTNGPNALIYTALAATALVQNDTVTLTATSGTMNYPIMDVHEVTGAATTSWLDGTPAGSSGTSTSPSSGNTTTANAADLIFGVMYFGAVTTTLTPGANLTLLANNPNSAKSMATEYRIVSSTGSYPANGTISNDDWAAVVAAYKEAPIVSTDIMLPRAMIVR